MIILGTNSIKDTGYDVANSLRFNSGSSDSLTITPSSASNRKTWTWSSWVKRSVLTSGDQSIFNAHTDAQNQVELYFNSDDSLYVTNRISNTGANLRTNAKFRDPSAWYHIVLAVDTTQGTDTNRMKLYVNGVQVTSFSETGYPGVNTDTAVNNNVQHRIGDSNLETFFNGYIAEAVLIDGQALAPDQFGEFDEDSGIWKPIDVSGLTFGTNGFYLEFKESGTGTNSSGMGADTSGNTNHFAVNNLTAIDQSTDTCTNNFATLNSLVPTASVTFSEGNLKLVGSSTGAYDNRSQSTFGVQSGKWYFEVEADALGNSLGAIGVGYTERAANINPTSSNTGDVCVRLDNIKYDEGSATSSYFPSSISAGDIIGVALDMNNGKIWFSKNGTFVGTVDSSGEASTFTVGNGITITPTFRPMNSTLLCNFGNAPYAISSGNADGNGYGNFEYAVPSGYYSLNTKNLAEYG